MKVLRKLVCPDKSITDLKQNLKLRKNIEGIQEKKITIQKREENTADDLLSNHI